MAAPRWSSRINFSARLLAVLAIVLLVPGSWGAPGPEPPAPPAPTPGTPGAPSVRNDSAAFSGTYVAGDLPASAAVLSNFTVLSTPVFREVAVEGYTRLSVSAAQGTVVVRGNVAELRLVDALAAYVTLDVTGNTTVSISPSLGSSFVADPSGGIRVDAGSLSGVLWATCASSALAMSSADAVLRNATRGCAVHFRADTSSDVVAAGELAEAIAASNLAAEISIAQVGNDSAPAVHLYAEVEVVVTVAPQRVVVAVSGSLATGRSVLVILPRQAIDASQPVEARYDGHAMALAGSARDALNASDDAGGAEFFISSEGNLTAIIVTVPSFSAHIAEVSAVAPAPAAGPSGVPAGDVLMAGAVGGAVTLLAAVSLFRPRRAR